MLSIKNEGVIKPERIRLVNEGVVKVQSSASRSIQRINERWDEDDEVTYPDMVEYIEQLCKDQEDEYTPRYTNDIVKWKNQFHDISEWEDCISATDEEWLEQNAVFQSCKYANGKGGPLLKLFVVEYGVPPMQEQEGLFRYIGNHLD